MQSSDSGLTLKSLFDQVVDLSPGARLQRLSELGADDRLVQQVLQLVGEVDPVTSQVTRALRPIGEALVKAATIDVKAGDRLGAWQIESLIAEGGMGSVYLAQRVDGHFQQTAAIKVLRGVAVSAALDRLAQERQILARLNHPNIARLLDGGASPAGHPYLVMEYVQGESIDAYCKRPEVERRQALELFLGICQAVAFAHRQLVIHCDLKPSNILVDQDGRVVLLDFGIASLVGDTSVQANATAYSPYFASPEQRNGAILTTATDVYSLGCILERLLRQDAPIELAAVVQRACADQTSDRYESVDALADDVRRHLSKLPLAAMPRTIRYRLSKFVQRRAWWVASGCVFAATVLILGIGLVQQRDSAQAAEQEARRQASIAVQAEQQVVVQLAATERARDEAGRRREQAERAELQALGSAQSARRSEVQARQEAAAAQAVSSFMESIFAGADPEQTGRANMSAEELLDQARRRITEDLMAHPVQRAAALLSVGRVYEALGKPKDAMAILTEAERLERARAVPRPLVLADILSRQANILGDEDRRLDGAKRAEEALRLREQALGPDALLVGMSLQLYGRLGATHQNWQQFDRMLLRALDIYRKRSPDDAYRPASLLHSRGLMLLDVEEAAMAEEVLREALRLKAITVGTQHPRYILTLEILARALAVRRKLGEAEAAFRQALAVRQSLYAKDSDKVTWTMQQLGYVLSDQGKHSEGLPFLKEAMRLEESQRGRRTMSFAFKLSGLGTVLEAAGQYAEARAAYEESIRLRTELAPKQVAMIMRPKLNLVRLLLSNRALDDAAALLSDMGEGRAAETVLAPLDRVRFEMAKSELDYLRGNVEQSRSRLQTLHPRLAQVRPFQRAKWIELWLKAAASELEFEEAMALHEQREQLFRDEFGAEHPLALAAPLARAQYLLSRGQSPKARELVLQVQQALHSSPIGLPKNSPAMSQLQELQARLGLE